MPTPQGVPPSPLKHEPLRAPESPGTPHSENQTALPAVLLAPIFDLENDRVRIEGSGVSADFYYVKLAELRRLSRAGVGWEVPLLDTHRYLASP